eukprot:3934694-Amphidinium_carterae.1
MDTRSFGTHIAKWMQDDTLVKRKRPRSRRIKCNSFDYSYDSSDFHLCSTLIATNPRVRSYRVTEEMDGDDANTHNKSLEAIEDARRWPSYFCVGQHSIQRC